jgi:hypothetical protein
MIVSGAIATVARDLADMVPAAPAVGLRSRGHLD